MLSEYKRYKGFYITEIGVASAVLTVILVSFALALHGFAKFNRFQLVKQQCIAAAQAQLDSIAATGKPITDEDFQRLWPKLSVNITKTAGTGQWQAITLVEVTVKGMSFSKEVQIKLSRYILENEP